ncbi:MAG: hypothetical protein IJE60_09855, partial [Tyzzerella sp.]|nr:hypothetical protein [Tyzzerella sp.]
LGVLLWLISPACSFAPTNAHVAPRLVLWTLLVTTAMTVLFPTQGKIRLWVLVRISTVFGTMAETGDFVFSMTMVRNFSSVKLGTIGMNRYLPACVEWAGKAVLRLE